MQECFIVCLTQYRAKPWGERGEVIEKRKPRAQRDGEKGGGEVNTGRER